LTQLIKKMVKVDAEIDRTSAGIRPAGPLSTPGDGLTFLHDLLTVQEVARQFEFISLHQPV